MARLRGRSGSLRLHRVAHRCCRHLDRRLAALEIPRERSVVLARTRGLRDRINQTTSVSLSRAVRAVGHATALIASQRTLDRDTVQDVDRMFSDLRYGHGALASMDPTQRRQLREATVQLFRRLPRLDGDLRNWTASLREAVKAVVDELQWELETPPSAHLRARTGHDAIQARDVFSKRICQPPGPHGPFSEGRELRRSSSRGRSTER